MDTTFYFPHVKLPSFLRGTGHEENFIRTYLYLSSKIGLKKSSFLPSENSMAHHCTTSVPVVMHFTT